MCVCEPYLRFQPQIGRGHEISDPTVIDPGIWTKQTKWPSFTNWQDKECLHDFWEIAFLQIGHWSSGPPIIMSRCRLSWFQDLSGLCFYSFIRTLLRTLNRDKEVQEKTKTKTNQRRLRAYWHIIAKAK